MKRYVIYEDPATRKKREGEAVVVSQVPGVSQRDKGLTYCYVRFVEDMPDGPTVMRWVSPSDMLFCDFADNGLSVNERGTIIEDPNHPDSLRRKKK